MDLPQVGVPPGIDPKRRRKDKAALELSAVLVRECWTLFELVWQVRNDILHSKDSSDAKTRNEHLTEQLLHFKYNADTMLQHGDRNQIDYPRTEILSWTRARKSGLLNLLKKMAQAILSRDDDAD